MHTREEARGMRQEARGESLGRNSLKRFSFFFFLFSFFFSLKTNAQCAMCRAVLETEEGGVKAESVNDGIVYLMVIPYILVAVIGYVVYKMKTKQKN